MKTLCMYQILNTYFKCSKLLLVLFLILSTKILQSKLKNEEFVTQRGERWIHLHDSGVILLEFYAEIIYLSIFRHINKSE